MTDVHPNKPKSRQANLSALSQAGSQSHPQAAALFRIQAKQELHCQASPETNYEVPGIEEYLRDAFNNNN